MLLQSHAFKQALKDSVKGVDLLVTSLALFPAKAKVHLRVPVERRNFREIVQKFHKKKHKKWEEIQRGLKGFLQTAEEDSTLRLALMRSFTTSTCINLPVDACLPTTVYLGPNIT
jgi:hypothetical protein